MISGDSRAVANLVAERIEIGEVSASAGFRVLALDFRGYGKSRGPGQSDP